MARSSVLMLAALENEVTVIPIAADMPEILLRETARQCGAFPIDCAADISSIHQNTIVGKKHDATSQSLLDGLVRQIAARNGPHFVQYPSEFHRNPRVTNSVAPSISPVASK